MLNKSTLALAVLFALAGCDKAQTPTQTTDTPPAAVAEVKTLTSGIEIANMDTSIKPQQDFFRYVNGAWLDKTEIPSDRNAWGSFNELRQKTDDNSLAILKEASKNPKYKSNTDQGKAVNLFNTVLDSVGRNKKGIEPLKPYLKKIDAIKTRLIKSYGYNERSATDVLDYQFLVLMQE